MRGDEKQHSGAVRGCKGTRDEFLALLAQNSTHV